METGGLIGIIFGIMVVIGGSVYVSMQKKTNTNPYDLTGSQYYGNTRNTRFVGNTTPQAYPSRYKSLYRYGNSYSSPSSDSSSYRRTGYRRHGGTRKTRVTKNKISKRLL